jgi:hypothetical protein
MRSAQKLIDRATRDSERNKFQLGEQLGFGIHGIVFACRKLGILVGSRSKSMNEEPRTSHEPSRSSIGLRLPTVQPAENCRGRLAGTGGNAQQVRQGRLNREFALVGIRRNGSRAAQRSLEKLVKHVHW